MKKLKPRKKSNYHRALEALDKRMELSNEEKLHLWNIQKGYEGEDSLDLLEEEFLKTDALVLDDLMFTEKGSSFQVDKLILTGDKISFLEVKNHEGNYQLNAGKFLTFSGKEITNYVTKLDNTAANMRRLLNKWNIPLALEPSLIFVNPSFTLYNAPVGSPIIFPSQIEKYFSEMNRRALPLTKKHYYYAERLLKEHQEEAAFQRKLPKYTYESLEKGLWCIECGSPHLKITQRSCTCIVCGHKASVNKTVLFHIEEFKLLFPHWKVTRNIIYEWCGKWVSAWLIQKILNDNYKRYGYARASHYQ